MPLEYDCQQCGRRLRVPDGSQGKRARCPACGHTFTLAASPADPAEVPAAAQDAFTGHLTSDPSPSPEMDNPYRSPAYAAPYVEPAKPLPHYVLASRGTRLVGAILDSLVYVVALLPGFFLFAAFPEESVLAVLGLVLIVGGLLAVSVWNWVMITTSGQSIAKRMLSMRIVGATDGMLPGFLRGVVIRNWLRHLISQFCSLFGLINALWIFGQEKRCLHDLMADTIVVDVRSESSPYHDRRFS